MNCRAKIQARYFVPIANAPYTEGGLNYLESKAVVCFPGFVVNAGGIFGSTVRSSVLNNLPHSGATLLEAGAWLKSSDAGPEQASLFKLRIIGRYENGI
jgi:hypothetical protein